MFNQHAKLSSLITSICLLCLTGCSSHLDLYAPFPDVTEELDTKNSTEITAYVATGTLNTSSKQQSFDCVTNTANGATVCS